MNKFTEEAVNILEDAVAKYTEVLEKFSENRTPEDFDEMNAMYQMDSKLKILVSQYADAEQTEAKEGPVAVHNQFALVEIAGVKITGNIQFELLIEGAWVKGHRENSSMGQVFVSQAGSKILVDGDKGRVCLPLAFDKD